MPESYHSVLQSDMMPLKKLWSIDFLTFLGLDGFSFSYFIKPSYLLGAMIFINFVAFIGVLKLKNWGCRLFSYILICMCIWGCFWPGLSSRALTVMETYMIRANYAWIFNHYWQPLKVDLCESCEKSLNYVTQYEPISYHFSEKLPNSYQGVKILMSNEIFVNSKELTALAPAYWGLFQVGKDVFISTKQMYQMMFSVTKVLFYLWFIIIPIVCFYLLHREKKLRFLENSNAFQQDNASGQNNFLDLIMENVVSGSIIFLAQIFGFFMQGIFSIYSLLLLSYFGYNGFELSKYAAKRYSKYFWLFGFCYIAGPIVLGLFLSGYLQRSITFNIIQQSSCILIYVVCFLGGMKGRQFILRK
ncbi:MAG: hypothetical protein KC733_06870 [Candidatus Omnitrophica bacterium]|nr:hypothetical protein [Candidatus Omnitrophota bacterium]